MLFFIWEIGARTAPSNGMNLLSNISTTSLNWALYSMPNLHYFSANLKHMSGMDIIVYSITFYPYLSIYLSMKGVLGILFSHYFSSIFFSIYKDYLDVFVFMLVGFCLQKPSFIEWYYILCWKYGTLKKNLKDI